MSSKSLFHEGELRVQERAGESAIAARNGVVISDTIPAGARPFLAAQSMLVLGSVDPQGELWASLLFGREGFLSSAEEGRAVQLDHAKLARDAADPLWANVEHDERLGLLVIELGSRRRLRVNGRVTDPTTAVWKLQVDEAYPNCPKYIQRRHLSVTQLNTESASLSTREGTLLGPDEQALVRATDTFFVASAAPHGGVDASHRGGTPGFTRVLDERTLRIPDYSGNSLFNTLGNLSVNPRAGLVLVDFEASRLLQLSGRVTIHWDLEDPEGRTAGTRRFWDFEVQRWRSAVLPEGLHTEFLDASPHNPSAV